SARSTDSAFFVIEADEYDTAFFDKRSKFVHYLPRTAVLNNLEFDHADIFPDLAAIETQFHHLVRTVPGSGLIIANAREQSMRRVLSRGSWSKVEWLGLDEGWIAKPRDEHAFDVFFEGGPRGTVNWTLLGEHNRNNALAALAGARHAGVPVAKGIDALAEFRNVKRRLEVCGTINGTTVYDDFAHHPTAIETTIAGLRSKVRNARILAVLEPRSNTMKMGLMKDALAGSLAGAEGVFCFTQGLGWDAQPVLAPLGAKAKCFNELGALVNAVVTESRPGDHILVMSNGSFGGVHAKILEALKAGSAV
ncbi:MAG: UDP-N-acetylmuramate:L-alanyl-gamma-D-glutamyl-meso-diaminopimelate ligase, partial [Betaproteobacteria bacterium]